MRAPSKILSPKNRTALCNMVRRIAVEAGALILEYFDGVRDMEAVSKDDGSPVTLADQEAEALIEKQLLNILPDISVVGEESFSRGARIDFTQHEYFWLVDPLDGTRAFIAGESEFTVNIGLIHNNEPVLGVIYAPEKGELYAGYCGDRENTKAIRYFEDSDTEKEIRTRKMPKQGLTILSSKHHRNAAQQEKMLEHVKVNKMIGCSSSLKLCLIANGKADIYPRLGPTCEWDTAAGHAILRAAGGDIHDMDGKPLKYGGSHPKLLNPHFIAASGDVFSSGALNAV